MPDEHADRVDAELEGAREEVRRHGERMRARLDAIDEEIALIRHDPVG